MADIQSFKPGQIVTHKKSRESKAIILKIISNIGSADYPKSAYCEVINDCGTYPIGHKNSWSGDYWILATDYMKQRVIDRAREKRLARRTDWFVLQCRATQNPVKLMKPLSFKVKVNG